MFEKPVIAVVEKGVNYLFHVQAVAKVNYDNEYGDIYRNSIKEEDLKYLKENENLLAFGGGNLSYLSYLYLFMPSSLNLDTQNKINDYFDLLCKAIEINDTMEFYKRYKPVLKNGLFFHGDLTNYFQKLISDIHINCADKAIKIAEIKNLQVWSIRQKHFMYLYAAAIKTGLMQMTCLMIKTFIIMEEHIMILFIL